MTAQRSRSNSGRARWRGPARLLTLCVLALLGSAGSASAIAADERAAGGAFTVSQTVVPVAEAWYRPESPTCAAAVGCLPADPPPAYPDGTLHVGVVGGTTESFTAISLPLPSEGARGGSLRLPVEAATDGTVQAASAKVMACVVTGTVTDKVAGSIGARPTPDCATSAPAVVTESGGSMVLTVDLAPFESEWNGLAVGSLALIPSGTPAASDVWHLAFSRHDRTTAGAHPLSASLLVPSTEPIPPPVEDPGVPAAPAATLPPVAPPPALGPAVEPGLDQSAPMPLVNTTSPGAVAQAPALAAAATFVPDTSFAYPGIFLLPPLLLLAGGWLAKAFTRDLANEQR